MKISTPSGSGRAIINGKLSNISWTTNNNDVFVTLPNGSNFALPDYEERLDFHYNGSDDGQIYYHTLVLLDPTEPEPSKEILSQLKAKDLQKASIDNITPLMRLVARQEIHSDDLAFALRLMTMPDSMVRAVQKYGNINAAQKAIVAWISRKTRSVL